MKYSLFNARPCCMIWISCQNLNKKLMMIIILDMVENGDSDNLYHL